MKLQTFLGVLLFTSFILVGFRMLKIERESNYLRSEVTMLTQERDSACYVRDSLQCEFANHLPKCILTLNNKSK